MHTYIVIGTLMYYIYSQPSEITISVKVEAVNTDSARDAVLAQHQAAAEQQDPQATVTWQGMPQVKRAVARAA